MLSRTQAGPGRTVEQDEISSNHVQRLNLITWQVMNLSAKQWTIAGYSIEAGKNPTEISHIFG